MFLGVITGKNFSLFLAKTQVIIPFFAVFCSLRRLHLLTAFPLFLPLLPRPELGGGAIFQYTIYILKFFFYCFQGHIMVVFSQQWMETRPRPFGPESRNL